MEKWEMVFYYVKISQLDILILPVWKPGEVIYPRSQ